MKRRLAMTATPTPPLMELPAIRLSPQHGARMRRVREGGMATVPAIGCYAVTCHSRYPKAGKSKVIPRPEREQPMPRDLQFFEAAAT